MDEIGLLFPSVPPGAGLRLSADDLIPLLITVRARLEGERAGSRFPAFREALRPLHAEDACPVSPAELLAEIAVIQEELGAVPGRAVPMFLFGDEGYPEVYGFESPRATGTARDRFQHVLGALKSFLAERTGAEIAPVRQGPMVLW